MEYILIIVGIIFEVLYYSLFMYYSKSENNFYKYFLGFTIVCLSGVILGNNFLLSYLTLIAMIVISLKYIMKIKITFYDIFFMFIMMVLKFIFEGLSFIILSPFINNAYIMAICLGLFKVLFLTICKNKLNMIYNKLRNLWGDNFFYIRYFFTTFMLIYVIVSCCFLIINK